jgi:hypothetical protein
MGMFSNPHTGFHPQREFEGGPQTSQATAPQASQGMILSFKIPEAQYSDHAFERLFKAFEVIEAVHDSLLLFGVEVAGLLGFGLEVLAGIPLLAKLLKWIVGKAYEDERAKVAKDRVTTGFAVGVVTGADRRTWAFARDLFIEYGPEANPFDERAGLLGEKNFNLGLACGFVQGRQLTSAAPTLTPKERFFWQSISGTLTPGDRSQFAGDRKLWPRQLWMSWYSRMARTFIELYVKD